MRITIKQLDKWGVGGRGIGVGGDGGGGVQTTTP